MSRVQIARGGGGTARCVDQPRWEPGYRSGAVGISGLDAVAADPVIDSPPSLAENPCDAPLC